MSRAPQGSTDMVASSIPAPRMNHPMAMGQYGGVNYQHSAQASQQPPPDSHSGAPPGGDIFYDLPPAGRQGVHAGRGDQTEAAAPHNHDRQPRHPLDSTGGSSSSSVAAAAAAAAAVGATGHGSGDANSDGSSASVLGNSSSSSGSAQIQALRRTSGSGTIADGPDFGPLSGTSAERLKMAMDSIVDLKVFLVTAPAMFAPNDIIRRFHLPSDEEVSCVRWNNIFYITGTDIVRCLTYRFAAFGRVITNKKKFEEGVFSDLRNLKCNVDATLEKPKSEFLEFLYKHHCVRTKKKQKVFFWYSVRHERLFIDALERDLKKEAAMAATSPTSEASTTAAVAEPALSFRYDPQQSLYDQMSTIIGELPTPIAALIDATVGSHVVPVGLSDQMNHGGSMHMMRPGPGGQIGNLGQLRFQQTSQQQVHRAQAQVQQLIQTQIQAQLNAHAQQSQGHGMGMGMGMGPAPGAGPMGQYPSKMPQYGRHPYQNAGPGQQMHMGPVPTQGRGPPAPQYGMAQSPIHAQMPKPPFRGNAPAAMNLRAMGSMRGPSAGLTPIGMGPGLPTGPGPVPGGNDHDRMGMYYPSGTPTTAGPPQAPDSAKYYEQSGWMQPVTPVVDGFPMGYPGYDMRQGAGYGASARGPPQSSEPGHSHSQNQGQIQGQNPQSQAPGQSQGAGSAGASGGRYVPDLDLEFAPEYPLEILRKEDLRLGNTPTSAFFPNYDDMYDHQARPAYEGTSPNVGTFMMPYVMQPGTQMPMGYMPAPQGQNQGQHHQHQQHQQHQHQQHQQQPGWGMPSRPDWV